MAGEKYLLEIFTPEELASFDRELARFSLELAMETPENVEYDVRDVDVTDMKTEE